MTEVNEREKDAHTLVTTEDMLVAVVVVLVIAIVTVMAKANHGT